MFNFPHADRLKGSKFKRNLLQSAIFQLKFPPFEIKTKYSELKSALSDKFQEDKAHYQSTAKIKFEIGETPFLESGTSFADGYEFRDKDQTKILVITKDSFTYTILGKFYTCFEDVYEEMNKSFFRLLKKCGIKEFNRIAIRKINLLESLDPENTLAPNLLRSAFNETIVNNYLGLPDSDSLEFGLSNFSLNKDHYKLNLSYGLLPKGPKSEAQKNQLLLDIDLFSLPKGLPFSKVGNEFYLINDEIFNIFNWALNKEVLKELNT